MILTLKSVDKEKGILFDIKKYSIHDGPGIRLTFFLSGCFLRCQWCHNPECFFPDEKIHWDRDKCLGCQWCVEGCPENAVSFIAGALRINHNRCKRCYNCIDNCPSDAIRLVGKAYTVSDLMPVIEREAPFLENSKGGVTISGGEPFYQSEFLFAFIQTLKMRGFHLALDTSGYTTEKEIMKAAGMIDLFLYDIKCIDRRKHIFYTGMSNKRILSNLRRLVEEKAPVQLRYPCIPGINDSESDIEELIEFLLSLPRIPEVRLLKYHDYAKEKYRRIGIEYALVDIDEQKAGSIETIKDRLNATGVKCEIGG